MEELEDLGWLMDVECPLLSVLVNLNAEDGFGFTQVLHLEALA